MNWKTLLKVSLIIVPLCIAGYLFMGDATDGIVIFIAYMYLYERLEEEK